MNSIRLGLFDYVNNLDAFHHINADQPVLNAVKNFTIASTCGAFGAWLGSPIFVVKTRLQVQNNARLTHPDMVIGEQYGYNGLMDGLRKIESTGGLKALYKNSTISSQRVFFGSGVQLTSYDQMKYLFSTYCGLNGTPLALCSSAVSSFLVTIAMNPLDLVLSRVNNQNINNPKYFGALDCFQKVLKHEGFSAFYKGFWAHYLRLAPHGITTFVCLEQFKLMFKGVSKREASLRQRTAQKD
jgi:solute carrier family 25 protein 34/35